MVPYDYYRGFGGGDLRYVRGDSGDKCFNLDIRPVKDGGVLTPAYRKTRGDVQYCTGVA